MEIIPAINCPDFKCVEERLSLIKDWKSEWAHIDIADGKFAPVTTWNNPQELFSAFPSLPNLEIHLMVNDPSKEITSWSRSGAKRIIVHLEAIDSSSIQVHKSLGDNCELGIALKPETPAEQALLYLKDVNFVQCLAVNPGFSGQSFQEHILDKVRFLRERHPGATIEVDGGINLEVAKAAKAAGANIAVSSSHIFKDQDPTQTYQELLSI
jgi:ribulose-phosphate 3-epimerase